MLKAPLNTTKPSPLRWFYRLYALVHLTAIFALVYRHCCNLIHSSSFTAILLLVADLVLAFTWTTWQAFFMNRVDHEVYPQNLGQVVKESEYPGLDVFVFTADPFKEPPIGVVNTVLSVLAYDYPIEKLSVYLSDDGGSQLTLFALMEAAKFARHWLPYCRKYDIMDRSPEVYFGKDVSMFPETSVIQSMYEDMKTTIQHVMDQGTINANYRIKDDRTIKAFKKWTAGFTRQQHPTVIEVLLKSDEDKDVTGHFMPNLFYIAREKNKDIPHNFKAGAINALIRVSAVMTNAPIFLILDCDMYSNDPKTPLRVLCHFMDPNSHPNIAFVQFPQRFEGVNKNDIYAGQHALERTCTSGMDGLGGTFFMGTGGFFKRQALIKYPTEPYGLWNESGEHEDSMELAHRVTSCSYENNTKWGSEIGFRYGVLVEDMYTGYHLQCLGWRSVTCDPTRAAFLGKVPITLNDVLSQSNRWYMGFLQTGLCKFSPITYGLKFLNPLHAMCYMNFGFRAFGSIPIIIYGFLPQITLINSLPIFPKVSDPWFSLYAFLFFGSHGKDFLDHMLAGSVFKRWWNARRMWLILGYSSYIFAMLNWFLTSIGMSTFEFNVTSKISESDLEKRYEKGVFEFGLESPLLLMISTTAVVNLFAFLVGIINVLNDGERFDEFFGQLFIAGLAVVFSWPIYEGMVFRSDKGKMPTTITLKSMCVALVICFGFSSAF